MDRSMGTRIVGHQPSSTTATNSQHSTTNQNTTQIMIAATTRNTVKFNPVAGANPIIV